MTIQDTVFIVTKTAIRVYCRPIYRVWVHNVDIFLFLSEQWLLVGLLAVLVATLIVVEGKRGGQSFSFHEVTRMVNKGEAIILDVREGKEYKNGHIVDALNIPHQKLNDRAGELEKHRAKTIVVVDKMGQHAGASGKVLKEKGYTVGRMQGGMTEWQGQNLPVVKGS